MGERIPVDAPVVRVELFEDRASVTRRVVLPAAAGRHRVVVEGLSPLLREAGLSFPEDGGVIVEEARVVRRRAHPDRADTPQAAALRDQLDALDDQVRRLEERRDREARRAEQARRFADAGQSWAPHALVREGDPRAFVDGLRRLERAAGEAWRTAAAREVEAAALARERAFLEQRLDDARHGRGPVRGRLELQVLAPANAALVIRYTIPCALWRPVHRARLLANRLSWQVGAMAWNATGEDWAGVELVCSTARPSTRAFAPVLDDDFVRTQRRDKEVVVETREEVIEVVREGKARAVDEVPGVDDGGEARTFTAPDPTDLRSDGRPVYIQLEGWEADAQTRWVAHPELGSAVVLRSVQVNAGTRPLLAGPVELVRDSGSVGRGRVGLVPPGEPFALGWGSHDEVRLSRRRDHEVERARITGKQTHAFACVTRLAHLGREPLTLTVRERVPVSELREVKVASPKASPSLHDGPDADGMCTWELTLEPGTVRKVEISYTVEAASNVRLPF